MIGDHKSFWNELKDRKVARVAILYLVVSWGVVEVSSTTASILELPEWTPKLILVLIMLGFPGALVMAWAFELTSAGVQRAPPLPTPSGHPLRWPFVAGLAVGIASVSAVAFVLGGGNGTGAPAGELDEDLVAVVPFQFSGPDELSYLGEGAAHLIAPRFDGEVGPRAVDPTSSSAIWQDLSTREPGVGGESDAEMLGAGFVLTGSVVAVGNGLAWNASLRRVSDGVEVAAAQAEGPIDSVTAVVDRLAAGLLALNAGEYRQSLAQLTSASPEALREYLLGQQASRRTQFDVSVEHFRRAVEIDSTFALAAIAWADAANNSVDTDVTEALDIAWRQRDCLDERDLRYLRARTARHLPDGLTRVERVSMWTEAVRDQPDRAFNWYHLGDRSFHTGEVRGEGWLDRVRGIFQEALDRDPTQGAAIMHLYFVDAVRGDIEDFRRSAIRMAAVDTTGWNGTQARVMLALTNPDTTGFGDAHATALERGVTFTYLTRFPGIVTEHWMVSEAERGIEAYLAFGRPNEANEILSRYEETVGRFYHEMRLMDAARGALGEDLGLEAAQAHEQQLRGKAASDYDAGVPLGPSVDSGMHFALAELYERLGEPEQALAILERETVFSVNLPQGAEYLRERGRLSALLGDTERAIREYRQYLLLRHNPEPELSRKSRRCGRRWRHSQARRRPQRSRRMRRSHLCSTSSGKGGYLDRCGFVGHGAVTQLSAVTLPPAEPGAVGSYAARMQFSHAHGGEGSTAAHEYGRKLVDNGVDSDCAREPPAIRQANVCQSTCMNHARAHGGEGERRAHRDGSAFGRDLSGTYGIVFVRDRSGA